MNSVNTFKKTLYLLSIGALSFGMTTCRQGGAGFCPGKVLVINESEQPSGAPDCLSGEVFLATQLEGTPVERISTCDSVKEIVAAPGDYFVKIRGDRTQKELFGNFISVQCNKVTTLTIVQKPIHLPLTIETTGTGIGVVRSEPLGIRCGETCQHLYQSGTGVMLHAEPDANSDFAGWTGACDGHEPTCSVTVSELKRVTAVFHSRQIPPGNQRLTVFVSGNGTGTVSSHPSSFHCKSNCTGFFQTNAEVVLTPSADPDSVFVGWSGACSGLNRCTVKLGWPTAAEARFVRKFNPSENHVAVKNYNPLSWDLFNRAFHPIFGDGAAHFEIPEIFHVTRGCSGNQWVTLHLSTANADGTIERHVCIYRDRDSQLDNAYHFELCATAPHYESECSALPDSKRCQQAAIHVRAGNVITPLELQLFLNDGDPACGTTVISAPAEASGNNEGDNNGDNGEGGDGDDNGDNGGGGDGDDNGDNGEGGDGDDNGNEDGDGDEDDNGDEDGGDDGDGD